MSLQHGKIDYDHYYLLFPGKRFNIRDDVIKKIAETPSAAAGGSGIPVGYTYLGQFIAHEITHFAQGDEPPTHDQIPPDILANIRTPSFDLDSLYGDSCGFGNRISNDSRKFTEAPGHTSTQGGIFHDLPRDQNSGEALIGDDRNDENMFVAQIHALFMNAHNRLVDLYAGAGEPDPFSQAREELTLLFQCIVRDDFLKRLLNRDVRRWLFEESKAHYLLDVTTADSARIPLEFSAAAFRFGHSLVRSSYKVLFNSVEERVSVGDLFDLTGTGGRWQEIHPDKFAMLWLAQADFEKYRLRKTWQHSQCLDTKMVEEMEKLTTEPVNNNNVILRNLKRSRQLGLQSAQQIIADIQSDYPDYANQMKLKVLDFSRITDHKFSKLINDHELDRHMPLWTYVLTEPAQYPKGSNDYHRRLGTLGSILVGEVLRALMITSRISIYSTRVDLDKGQFARDLIQRYPGRQYTHEDIGLEDLIAFVHSI